MFRDPALIQNFVVGMLLPLLISVVNQARWPKPVKGIVALLMCLLAAAVVEMVRGGLTFTGIDYGATVIVIFTTAFGFYQLLWKPSAIGPGIEAATSTSPGVPQQRTG